MSGIEILSVVEVVTKYEYFWFIFWFFTASFSTLCALISKTLKDPLKDILKCAVLGASVGAMIGAMIMTFNKKPVAYENHYKVTISDEVNFIEFNNKYEVIDQDGLIYTIRER